mmetsp:Transcript_5889/g.12405  ORF Transcript_5889/g.12405 Transcript_5889/m.12405 type:complete len:228 (+) Transcript_5889:1049-1732(+)
MKSLYRPRVLVVPPRRDPWVPDPFLLRTVMIWNPIMRRAKAPRRPEPRPWALDQPRSPTAVPAAPRRLLAPENAKVLPPEPEKKVPATILPPPATRPANPFFRFRKMALFCLLGRKYPLLRLPCPNNFHHFPAASTTFLPILLNHYLVVVFSKKIWHDCRYYLSLPVNTRIAVDIYSPHHQERFDLLAGNFPETLSWPTSAARLGSIVVSNKVSFCEIPRHPHGSND